MQPAIEEIQVLEGEAEQLEIRMTPTAVVEGSQTLPAEPTSLPAVPENRLLILEWPPKMRLGETDWIRLTLEMDEGGNLTPTAQTAGNVVRGEPVQIPNVYDTHNVVAQARLDLAGAAVAPSGEVSEALLPGQPVIFLWNIRPQDAGTYRGTIWVYLRFVPLDGSPASRTVLSTQMIEFEVDDLFGMNASVVRTIGVVGGVVGAVFGLDDVVLWSWRRLTGRKRREPQPSMEDAVDE